MNRAEQKYCSFWLTLYFHVDGGHSEFMLVRDFEQSCVWTLNQIKKNQRTIQSKTIVETQLRFGLEWKQTFSIFKKINDG